VSVPKFFEFLFFIYFLKNFKKLSCQTDVVSRDSNSVT